MPRSRFSLRTLLIVVMLVAFASAAAPLLRAEYHAWQERRSRERLDKAMQEFILKTGSFPPSNQARSIRHDRPPLAAPQ